MTDQKKKKGRTMSPEMLEKLKVAREKGLAKIKENRELLKKIKSKPPPVEESDSEKSIEEDMITRHEEPPAPKMPLAKLPPKKSHFVTQQTPSKYSGVRKVKKTKVIYLTDDDSESEEEVVVKKPNKKIKQRAEPQVAQPPSVVTEEEYIDPLLAKYNMY